MAIPIFNVCDGLEAPRSAYVTLKNENTHVVIVYPALGKPWPFYEPHNSFIVPAKVGIPPGDRTVRLVSDPANIYAYSTSGCPGDPTVVNPKNVIIT